MQARRKKHLPIKVEKNTVDSSAGKTSLKPMKAKDKNMKTKKRKRLIIRNLSFQVTPDELQDTFSQFGNVVNVNIPLKEDGRKRGFAFVEFEDFKSLIKAMKALNNKEIHGRRVAIDYAVDKTNYQLKLQSIKKEKEDSPQKDQDIKLNSLSDVDSEDEKPDVSLIESEEEDIDEDEKRVNEFLKEFDSGCEVVQHDDEDSSDESSKDSDEDDEVSDDEDEESDNESDFNEKLQDTNKHSPKDKFSTNRKISHDVSEGKTVFLRNVSFATTKDGLREAMEGYGECEYCVICVDHVTEHSKGTAFVKFKSKESADKLIGESMNEPGILVDGRKLTCSPAVSKETISQQKDQLKKPTDRRNLRLLKIGLILPNSEESEGVSPSDMAKRSQLERLKNQKLKNVNFFVSDRRLMIHNLPKTLTDAKLKKLFKETVGKGAAITEARVMRDFKKTSSEGIPLSRGFGFVSFSKHEDALKAIEKLNNNPKAFTPQKRPIVEFSVENKVALLTKERRREKLKQRNMKRTVEKKDRKTNQNQKEKSETLSDGKILSKKTRKRKRRSEVKESSENTKISSGSPRKKQKKGRNQNSETFQDDRAANTFEDSEMPTEKTSKKKQKKKNKRKSKKTMSPVKSGNVNQETFNNMVNKFKEKLFSKI